MRRRKKVTKPLFWRDPTGRVLGWEIYGLGHWFITIGFGSVELQFNKWPSDWAEKG
jgi:hypothetical protein